MRRLIAATAGLFLASHTPPSAAELSLSCSALGKEYEICKEGADAWAKKTGNTVKIVSTPNSATERLALYQQLLAAGAADIDVFQIDVVWPGLLGRHFVDLTSRAQAQVGQHFPVMVQAATSEGKLVAMPWFADAGLLYYRQDLLQTYGRPLPQTWEELTETARIVQEGERKAGKDAFIGLRLAGESL